VGGVWGVVIVELRLLAGAELELLAGAELELLAGAELELLAGAELELLAGAELELLAGALEVVAGFVVGVAVALTAVHGVVGLALAQAQRELAAPNTEPAVAPQALITQFRAAN
jgi:hypothetical protein